MYVKIFLNLSFSFLNRLNSGSEGVSKILHIYSLCGECSFHSAKKKALYYARHAII